MVAELRRRLPADDKGDGLSEILESAALIARRPA
jgi:hypothetical protein